MKIKPRSFPHPVMARWRDDISPFDLNIQFEPVRCDQAKYYLKYRYEIGNSTYKSLLHANTIALGIHVECQANFYRRVFIINESDGELAIDADELIGKVEVNAIVIAYKNIQAFTPEGMHKDYMGAGFSVLKGDYLAIGDGYDFDANKEYDSIQKISSIIAFDPLPDRKSGAIDVDVMGEKLVGLLPSDLHKRYDLLKQQAQSTDNSILSTLLVLPVLMEGIQHLKTISEGPFEVEMERRWVRVVWKKIKESGLDIKTASALELAQYIMADPFERTSRDLAALLGGAT